jgi:hypothetical protein
MRPFLLALAIIAPVLLTAAALGYVSSVSRRYANAEAKLVARLEKLDQQELTEYADVAKRFLRDPGQDLISLARTIEFVTRVAATTLGSDSGIIIRILRHGTDYNKARYLDMLFAKVDPRRPPRPPFKRDNPNQPGPSSAATLELKASREIAGLPLGEA